jgi:hypothetical protein
VSTARAYVSSEHWDRKRSSWTLDPQWAPQFTESPPPLGPDLLPELTEEGIARFAEILSAPARRGSKLAAALARKK